MFDDIGGKIKNLAVVTCIVGIIGSVIGAIVIWGQSTSHYSTTGIGFLVLIFGSLISWVGSFYTYGFGELIEETSLNRRTNAEILNKIKCMDSPLANIVVSSPAFPLKDDTVSAAVPVKDVISSTSTADTAAQNAPESADVPISSERNCIPIDDNLDKCMVCGTVQRSGRTICWQCGAKFIRK